MKCDKLNSMENKCFQNSKGNWIVFSDERSIFLHLWKGIGIL